jgi:hypothetical protein
MPSVGDTQKVPCSWCGEIVIEIYRPYPPVSGVVGFFWDTSACPCGSTKGMIAFASAGSFLGRTNTYRRSRGIKIKRPELN